MYKLAFDFYDSNCDEKISELDLFKVLQYYGSNYEECEGTFFTDYI